MRVVPLTGLISGRCRHLPSLSGRLRVCRTGQLRHHLAGLREATHQECGGPCRECLGEPGALLQGAGDDHQESPSSASVLRYVIGTSTWTLITVSCEPDVRATGVPARRVPVVPHGSFHSDSPPAIRPSGPERTLPLHSITVHGARERKPVGATFAQVLPSLDGGSNARPRHAPAKGTARCQPAPGHASRSGSTVGLRRPAVPPPPAACPGCGTCRPL